MSNKIRYICFQLPDETIQEMYNVGKWIEENSQEYKFIPMDYNQVHMTVCFLGDLSKNLKDNKKAKMDQIQTIINDFPEINQLTFSGYELFSIKQNLIVAKFNLPEKTKKQIIEFKKMFVEYGAPLENYFTPHITLGKLMNKSDSGGFDCSKIPMPETIVINQLKCKLN